MLNDGERGTTATSTPTVCMRRTFSATTRPPLAPPGPGSTGASSAVSTSTRRMPALALFLPPHEAQRNAGCQSGRGSGGGGAVEERVPAEFVLDEVHRHPQPVVEHRLLVRLRGDAAVVGVERGCRGVAREARCESMKRARARNALGSVVSAAMRRADGTSSGSYASSAMATTLGTLSLFLDSRCERKPRRAQRRAQTRAKLRCSHRAKEHHGHKVVLAADDSARARVSAAAKALPAGAAVRLKRTCCAWPCAPPGWPGPGRATAGRRASFWGAASRRATACPPSRR